MKHQLESQGRNLVITLIDPARPAKVTRTLNESLLGNTPLLYDVIRDAVNELRAIGCHPPISEHEILLMMRALPPANLHSHPVATSHT